MANNVLQHHQLIQISWTFIIYRYTCNNSDIIKSKSKLPDITGNKNHEENVQNKVTTYWTCSGSNAGIMTQQDPHHIGVCRQLTLPWTWCNGSTCRSTSFLVHPQRSSIETICACRLPYVCTTPCTQHLWSNVKMHWRIYV